MTQTVVNESDTVESTSAVTAEPTVLQVERCEIAPEEPQRRAPPRGFIGLVNSWKDAIRPWSEFFNLHRFSLPSPIKQTPKRIKKNLSYFPANYFVIILILSFCCIITSFWLLISTIVLAVAFVFIRSKTAHGPLVVGGETVPSWLLYAVAVFAIIPLLIFADVGYLLYCAVGTGIVLILLHATFFGNGPLGPVIPRASVASDTPQMVINRPVMQEREQFLDKSEELPNMDSPHSQVRFAEESAV